MVRPIPARTQPRESTFPTSGESRSFAGLSLDQRQRETPAPAWPRRPCCCFSGMTRCQPGLVEGHLRYHRASPERHRALLGLVKPCPPLNLQPLQIWLHRSGTQFGYGDLKPGIVDPTCFWTSNISVKRTLFEEVGGFDESFPHAACEDTELGFRLARVGMELTYSNKIVVEHFHPTNLALTLARMRRVGLAYRRLVELAPEMPVPPRPSFRHRLKALALEASCMVSRAQASDAGAWRFLCDQVLREAYWGDEAEATPQTGRRLARLALEQPEANPPLDVLPFSENPEISS